MHPFFCFQRVIGLGSVGLVITKIFWEKLVAVKWSVVGSMYMLLNRAKIQRVFRHLKCVFMKIRNIIHSGAQNQDPSDFVTRYPRFQG